MQAFADLLDRLVLTPSRNGKLRLLTDYFRATPDPDRGYALAALAGTLDIPGVKPKLCASWCSSAWTRCCFAIRMTMSAIWRKPSRSSGSRIRRSRRRWRARRWPMSCMHCSISAAPRRGAMLRDLLDSLPSGGRFAFLKLATGGLRIGVSARLAKQALAGFGDQDITEIETLWHGQAPPYVALFAWLEGRGEKRRSRPRRSSTR